MNFIKKIYVSIRRSYYRVLRKILIKNVLIRREKYYNKLAKRLKNEDFSLITNNCCGGVIYHNLGKRFLSPTINLWMEDKDYVKFCVNINYFLKGELTEMKVESGGGDLSDRVAKV